MSSAAEDELRSIFNNSKEASPLQVMLEDMGHPQPPIPIQRDKSNNALRLKRSKIECNKHVITKVIGYP
jgi:hypothetical protein